MISYVVLFHRLADGAYYPPVAMAEIEHTAVTVTIDIPRPINVIEVTAVSFSGNKHKVKLRINVDLARGNVIGV